MGIRDDLIEGRVLLPSWGEVVAVQRKSLPWAVVDSDGAEVGPVCQFLRDLALSDRSPLTVRSYAHDLLRWWRVLRALNVLWNKATTAEVAVMVGWLRHAPNPQRARACPAGAVNARTGADVAVHRGRRLPAGIAGSNARCSPGRHRQPVILS